jgi:23S rRNA (pseudouridine1915-N3)-methyltransferase
MTIALSIVGIASKKEMAQDELDRYIRLLKPYASLSVIFLKGVAGNFRNREDALAREAALLSRHVQAGTYPVALSEDGKEFTSQQFASWISDRFRSQTPLVFIIGSAYGLGETVRGQCRECISLSAMTFPHRLCYIILAEQIYRACTILKGHPYHK